MLIYVVFLISDSTRFLRVILTYWSFNCTVINARVIKNIVKMQVLRHTKSREKEWQRRK